VLLTQSVYLSTEPRSHFLKRHAPRLAGALRHAASIRKDLDPGFAALSSLSMLVFPQIARSVVGRVFAIQFDEKFAKAFAMHIAKLFGEREESHG
jgi:hypothetical protein